MRKYFLLVVFLLIIIITFACSGKKAVKYSEERVKIFVLTDIGNPEEIPEVLYSNRIKLSKWMERDIIRLLNRAGYNAKPIMSRDEYLPRPGQYLLKITILSQHDVPPSARIWAGRYAGPYTLTNRYELFGKDETPLLAYEEGVGSVRSQRHNARKLNSNAVKKIKKN
jgi:hypothetical protein